MLIQEEFMTAKQQLHEVQAIECRINNLAGEKKEIKRALAFVQSNMMRGSNPPGMKYIKKWSALLEQIEEEQNELIKAKQAIIDRIDSLRDARYSLLLYKRYVEIKPFRRIAEEMAYSEDRIMHLHNDAVKAFEQASESEI